MRPQRASRPSRSCSRSLDAPSTTSTRSPRASACAAASSTARVVHTGEAPATTMQPCARLGGIALRDHEQVVATDAAAQPEAERRGEQRDERAERGERAEPPSPHAGQRRRGPEPAAASCRAASFVRGRREIGEADDVRVGRARGQFGPAAASRPRATRRRGRRASRALERPAAPHRGACASGFALFEGTPEANQSSLARRLRRNARSATGSAAEAASLDFLQAFEHGDRSSEPVGRGLRRPRRAQRARSWSQRAAAVSHAWRTRRPASSRAAARARARDPALAHFGRASASAATSGLTPRAQLRRRAHERGGARGARTASTSPPSPFSSVALSRARAPPHSIGRGASPFHGMRTSKSATEEARPPRRPPRRGARECGERERRPAIGGAGRVVSGVVRGAHEGFGRGGLLLRARPARVAREVTRARTAGSGRCGA